MIEVDEEEEAVEALVIEVGEVVVVEALVTVEDLVTEAVEEVNITYKFSTCSMPC